MIPDTEAQSPDFLQSVLPDLSREPYPGLRPFLPEESIYYFGRDSQIQKLRSQLEQHHFVAVIGSSGCGKSSLVYAGLIPGLQSGWLSSAGSVWRVATMRPGDRPIQRLASALLKATTQQEETFSPEDAAIDAALLAATLRRSDSKLVQVVQDLLPQSQSTSATDSRANLLLFVDQFEEIFRYRSAGNAEEADRFVSLLVSTVQEAKDRLEDRAFVRQEAQKGYPPEERQAITSAVTPPLPIYILLTMRSDFLGKCSLFSNLAETFNESQFLTPSPGRSSLTEAIQEPARVYARTFALKTHRSEAEGSLPKPLVNGALTNRLLNDLNDVLLWDTGEDAPESDQLPLLQHAMMRLWTSANRNVRPGVPNASLNPLRLEDYEKFGGKLRAVLDAHGEELYQAVGESAQRATRLMFCRLTERFGGRSTRRPTTLADIAAVVAADALPADITLDSFSDEERSRLVEDNFRQVAKIATLFALPEHSFLTVNGELSHPGMEADLKPDAVVDLMHEALFRSWRRLRKWMDEEAESRTAYERLSRSARGFAAAPPTESRLTGPTLAGVLYWKTLSHPTFEWIRRYLVADDTDPAKIMESQSEFKQAMSFLEASRIDWENKAKEDEDRRVASEKYARERAELRAQWEKEARQRAELDARLAKAETEHEALARQTAEREKELLEEKVRAEKAELEASAARLEAEREVAARRALESEKQAAAEKNKGQRAFTAATAALTVAASAGAAALSLANLNHALDTANKQLNTNISQLNVSNNKLADAEALASNNARKALSKQKEAEEQRNIAKINEDKAKKEEVIAKNKSIEADKQKKVALDALNENKVLVKSLRSSELATRRFAHDAIVSAENAERQRGIAVSNEKKYKYIAKANETLAINEESAKEEALAAKQEALDARDAALASKKEAVKSAQDAATFQAQADSAKKLAEERQISLTKRSELAEGLLLAGGNIPSGYENTALQAIVESYENSIAQSPSKTPSYQIQAALTQAVLLAGRSQKFKTELGAYAKISPDGDYLYFTSDGGKAVHRKRTDGQPDTGWIDIKSAANIRMIAVSPKGGKLAVVSDNGPVMVANARTGSDVFTLDKTEQSYWAIFSPDEDRLVTLRSGSASLWDMTAKVLVPLEKGEELTGHPVAAFAALSNRLAIANGQKARFYDPHTGKLNAQDIWLYNSDSTTSNSPTQKGQSSDSALYSLALSPNGSWLLALPSNDTAWEYPVIEEGKRSRLSEGRSVAHLDGIVQDAEYLNNDTLLAGSTDGSISVYKRQTDTLSLQKRSVLGGQNNIQSVGYVHSNQPYSIDRNGTVILWEEYPALQQASVVSATQQNLRSIAIDAASSPSRAFTLTDLGGVNVLDPATLSEGAAIVSSDLSYTHYDFPFAVDDRAIIAVRSELPFILHNGRKTEKHGSIITIYGLDQASLSPDLSKAIAAKPSITLHYEENVTAIATMPILAASLSGNSGIREKIAQDRSDGKVSGVYVILGGYENTGSNDTQSSLQLWKWPERKRLCTQSLEIFPRLIQIAPNGRFGIVLLGSGTMMSFAIDKDGISNPSPVKYAEGLVSSSSQDSLNNVSLIKIAPNSSEMAVGCLDGRIYRISLDPATGSAKTPPAEIDADLHKEPMAKFAPATALTYSTDGLQLAAGLSDGKIQVFALPQGAKTGTYQLHAGQSISSIAFAAGNQTLLSSDNSGLIVRFPLSIETFYKAAQELRDTLAKQAAPDTTVAAK